jgi:hypothetical protein
MVGQFGLYDAEFGVWCRMFLLATLQGLKKKQKPHVVRIWRESVGLVVSIHGASNEKGDMKESKRPSLCG